ncbi:MAG: HYR domain-containing protein [Bacteroidetes bacterium]|nr:HYR domain-containing protein [Bacteroidota bacterium]
MNNSNFSCANTGANTVVLTVLDIHGNSSNCTATITVQDNINPTITCPANITVSNDAGLCSAVVGYTATAADNCSATVSYSIAPGSVFAVGTGSVTATATDPSGNAVNCTFTVTVNDNENPTITCPANVNVSCVRDLPAANTAVVGSSDNCGVAAVTHVGDVTTGTGCTGNARVILRTYRVTDIYGNSVTCVQTLTALATPVIATASNDVVVFPAYADSACATISVVGAGGCAPYTYNWSNGSQASSQNVCPTVSTTYFVTVTDAQGCTGVDSVRVCAIDITCVGVKMADEPAAAMELESEVTMRAFPNPTNGALTVELACQNCTEDATYQVKVSDIYGKQLGQIEITLSSGEASTKLDLSQYAAGVYMITATNGDQRLVERIVKQ